MAHSFAPPICVCVWAANGFPTETNSVYKITACRVRTTAHGVHDEWATLDLPHVESIAHEILLYSTAFDSLHQL